MKKTFLESLHCPFCNKPLQTKREFWGTKLEITNGIVGCSCRSYPIISNVLFLAKDGNTKKALRFIKKHQNLASKYPEIPFFLLRLPENLLFIVPFFVRVNIFKNLTLGEFVRLATHLRVINKDWSQYLLNRYSRADFSGAKKAIKLVRTDFRVLDAGCGAGHLLSLIAKRMKTSRLVGIDKSILNIYMAAKYLGRGSNLVYLNIEDPLPFSDKFFNMVISNDVLSYISNKKLLANEIKRILEAEGLVALTNLNNKQFADSFKTPPPHALAFGDYIKLFPKFEAKTLKGSEKTRSFSIAFKKS